MPKNADNTFSRNVTVVFNFDRGGKCALFPDISDEEIFAIGRVTVSWALLEHAILDDCARMAAARRVAIPEGAFKVALKPRLRVWREMITKYRKGKPRELMLKIVSRVANAQRSRNQITHGLWSWDYNTVDRITAKSYKPNFGFTQSFDFQKLVKLSETLGQINFELASRCATGYLSFGGTRHDLTLSSAVSACCFMHLPRCGGRTGSYSRPVISKFRCFLERNFIIHVCLLGSLNLLYLSRTGKPLRFLLVRFRSPNKPTY